MSSDSPQKWALHFRMYLSKSSSVLTSTGSKPVIFVKRSTSRRVSLMLLPRRIISVPFFHSCLLRSCVDGSSVGHRASQIVFKDQVMSMTKEALDMIELDAACASAPVLDRYISVVRESIADATHEVQEHARALLLKLEHLVNNQRAERAAATQEYLAPWITLAEPERAAA